MFLSGTAILARDKAEDKMRLHTPGDPQKKMLAALKKLAAGALVSTLISILFAAIFGSDLGRPESHLLFLVVVGAIGILLGTAGYIVDRFDASFVFAFFLFEPIGPVLLHQVPVAPSLGVALPLGLLVAFLFGRKGSVDNANDSGSP